MNWGIMHLAMKAVYWDHCQHGTLEGAGLTPPEQNAVLDEYLCAPCELGYRLSILEFGCPAT